MKLNAPDLHLKQSVLSIFLTVAMPISALAVTQSSKEIAPCEIQNQAHTRVRSVTFPDGRTLTILGHNHGDRNVPMLVFDLANSTQKQITNAEFIKKTEAIVKTEAVAVAHAQEDLVFLRQFLKEKDIQFVAVEDVPATVAMTDTYSKLKNSFHQQVIKRGFLPSRTFSDLLLITSGVPNYLKINNADLMADVPIYGFESDAAIAAEDRAYENLDKAVAKIEDAAKNDKAFLEKFYTTRIQLRDLYPNYDPKKHDESFLRQISEKTPTQYRELSIEWIKAEIALMKATKRRDHDVATGMVGSGQSGILFVGLAHLESLAGMISMQCKLGGQNGYNYSTSASARYRRSK